ncbi:type VI secretion system baseplate subunit TssE [Derxia lacustris]|uniref:type VI secretion system baseplate subunit TssE n=1 Tax=Derxia lacustris TaxID=764842 RepID=UPI000A178496|nr:type VI secretion system baseplate subunit TssE [Derxia lacustris]
MHALLPVAPIPLFDRLCADADAASGATLDAAGLEASIACDLARLLGTRSRLGFDAFLAADPTVVDYGLPDISALSAGSGDDLALLRRAVEQAIRRYEPRLLDARIAVAPVAGAPHLAQLRIDAAMRLGGELRRVRFELDAEPGSARVGAA